MRSEAGIYFYLKVRLSENRRIIGKSAFEEFVALLMHKQTKSGMEHQNKHNSYNGTEHWNKHNSINTGKKKEEKS
jgi:hypothetical protein